ncbi:MAG TPA: Asp-tRNA(Asn)/Glu-tRNA(Gln) amidotransferase GatCAB subunit A [Lachnospiraceae bacterium]|nr:Asp-tRNA(Asn)/Glu-tRNA(Gln) amidotransferase GatCAB subunit A [Lachnospiraceae bacterium]
MGGNMELLSLSAVELGRLIREGKATAVEAMQAVLEQIDKSEELYNCYVTVDREKALKKAEEVQRKIESGELSGPLAGVPVAVKDNLCTEGMTTTCSSRILGNFIPTYSADAVLKLEQAGAVIIGKTNMDEFAMGSTTETSAYGPTRNPRGPEHVPGGSSGGSAAAVAAGECFFALGSDTGGSIRQPASHCGVVGMKPTYGTVSRYGLVAYGSSLDQIGPLCKTVEDCTVVLEAIAGPVIKTDACQCSAEKGETEKTAAVSDSTLIARGDTDFTTALKNDVKGMRIGIPKAYIPEVENNQKGGTGGLSPEVRGAVLKAAGLLEANGAVVETFDLGLVDYAIPAYYTIAAAEASSNLERFDGIKYGYRDENARELHQMYKETRSRGFGDEAKRRIMLGSFVLSSGYYDAYYLKALRVKAMIKKAFDEAFEKYDCILGPVAPTTAPKLGESLADPIQMYLGDIYTISVNLAGLPAISVPCGADEKGLPIGLQLIGDCFQEKKLLQIAYTYEQLRG